MRAENCADFVDPTLRDETAKDGAPELCRTGLPRSSGFAEEASVGDGVAAHGVSVWELGFGCDGAGREA